MILPLDYFWVEARDASRFERDLAFLPVRGLEDEDMVAGFQGGHRGRQDGRHSRCGRDAGLRTFERREPLLESGHGGIGEARIDIARRVVAEAVRGLRGILEHEARGEEQPFRVLVELAAMDAGAHRQRFDVVVLHVKSPIKKPVQLSLRRVFTTL